MSCTSQAQGWLVYQPLFVGLGAVVLGLFANSILEWFKQSHSRKNEASSLRAALIAELTINRNDLLGRFDTTNVIGNSKTASTLMVPLGSHTLVYESSIAKLGLLKPHEVASIIGAYNFVVAAPKNAAHLGVIKGDDFYRWAEINEKYRASLVEMDRKTVELINTALANLSNKARGDAPHTTAHS